MWSRQLVQRVSSTASRWAPSGWNATRSIGGTIFVCGTIFIEEKARRSRGDNEDELPIFKIVLTGGPCGGKSTAMAAISERLNALGYQVFVVPEVATLLVTSGLKLATPRTPQEWMEVQSNIMEYDSTIHSFYL